MKYVRIPGFLPINWYAWHGVDDHGNRWMPKRRLWRYRLVILRNHRRFAR